MILFFATFLFGKEFIIINYEFMVIIALLLVSYFFFKFLTNELQYTFDNRRHEISDNYKALINELIVSQSASIQYHQKNVTRSELFEFILSELEEIVLIQFYNPDAVTNASLTQLVKIILTSKSEQEKLKHKL